MRYKLITGVAREDQENFPNVKDFDTALDDAVKEYYVPIFNTFRITRVEGNILFTIMVEKNDIPEFIGGNKNG